MSLKNVNTVLTTLCFRPLPRVVLHPGPGGVHSRRWPAGLARRNGDGFLIMKGTRMKGTREFSMGLVIGILLLTRHRRALGWVLLMEAVAPFGDMINVLAHHGPSPPRSASTA
jgi:uncharacterized protein DUF4267